MRSPRVQTNVERMYEYHGNINYNFAYPFDTAMLTAINSVRFVNEGDCIRTYMVFNVTSTEYQCKENVS